MYTQRLLLQLIIGHIVAFGEDAITPHANTAFKGILDEEQGRGPRVLQLDDVAKALHKTMAPHGKIDLTYAQLNVSPGGVPADKQIADKMMDCATYQSEDALESLVQLLRRFVIELDGVGHEVSKNEAERVEQIFTRAQALDALTSPWFKGSKKHSLPQA